VYRRIAILIMLLVPSFSFANDCNNIKRPNLILINGIWNTKGQAEVSLSELKDKLRKTSTFQSYSSVNLLHNETHGVVQDLVDVLIQKAEEQPSAEKNIISLVNIALIRGYGSIYDMFSAVVLDPLLSVFTTSEIKTAIADLQKAATYSDYIDTDFEDIVAQFYALGAGNSSPILLMPHSQGSIYANQLGNYLKSKGFTNIEAVAVATPANTVLGWTSDMLYVTHDSDGVINMIRFIFKSVLPSDLPGTGHEFVNDYLSDTPSWAAIQQCLALAVSRLSAKTLNAPFSYTTFSSQTNVNFDLVVSSSTGFDMILGMQQETSVTSSSAGVASYCPCATPTRPTVYVAFAVPQGSSQFTQFKSQYTTFDDFQYADHATGNLLPTSSGSGYMLNSISVDSLGKVTII